MPAMGIDVLERDSTTQTWARQGGGGGIPQVIKKKEGMGRKVLFFFALTISFLFCYRFFFKEKMLLLPV